MRGPGSDVVYWSACRAAQCNRKVGQGIEYCCSGCRIAWESSPRYDADGYHSAACDGRAAERGEFSTYEAAVRRNGWWTR